MLLVIYTRLDTTIESREVNGSHAVRDGHRGQAAATKESRVANGSHAVRDGHGGQAATTIESRAANGSHAVRDGHGGQAAATRESRNVNGSNAVSYIIISNSARDIDISRILVRIRGNCSRFHVTA